MGFRNFAALYRRDSERVVSRGELNTGSFTAFWDEVVPGSGAFNPNVQASYPDTMVQSGSLSGFIHFVQAAKSGIRLYAEVEVGDAIIDLPGGFNLDGKKNLRFKLPDEKTYVPKDAGDALAKNWDVIIGGQGMMRGLLLTQIKRA